MMPGISHTREGGGYKRVIKKKKNLLLTTTQLSMLLVHKNNNTVQVNLMLVAGQKMQYNIVVE